MRDVHTSEEHGGVDGLDGCLTLQVSNLLLVTLCSPVVTVQVLPLCLRLRYHNPWHFAIARTQSMTVPSTRFFRLLNISCVACILAQGWEMMLKALAGELRNGAHYAQTFPAAKLQHWQIAPKGAPQRALVTVKERKNARNADNMLAVGYLHNFCCFLRVHYHHRTTSNVSWLDCAEQRSSVSAE